MRRREVRRGSVSHVSYSSEFFLTLELRLVRGARAFGGDPPLADKS